MKSEPSGLYIHVPFCLSKCGYCSFYSVASPELIPEFANAIVKEMAFYKNTFQTFNTVYLGGGTPSLLSNDQIQAIFNAVLKLFKISRQAEITIEVNPGDISVEYLKDLRALGINRLNIGIQAFDDRALRFLGRRHTSKEAKAAIDAARKADFDNIGIDLIYCVAGQDLKMWRETLKHALSFSPEHLSCYQLSLDFKTPLYKHYQQEGFSLPSENEALDFFLTTSQMLTDTGYLHYEVSNFACSDALRSKHNMKYWQHAAYLGLGPAAHSYADGKRWWNKADIEYYLTNIASGNRPIDQSETLSPEQLALEALFLGLRTKVGIDLRQYKTDYGIDLRSDKKQTIEALIKNKLVELKDERLCPTLAGMAVADSLALIQMND